MAGVLSISHKFNISVPCSVKNDCATVAQHASSQIGGISVAYIGLAGYLAILILTVVRLNAPSTKAARLLTTGTVMTAVGTAFSLYLQYVAIFVIKAKCDWCIASAITMTALFVVHMMITCSDKEGVMGNIEEAMLIACGLIAIGGVGAIAVNMRSAGLKSEATSRDVSELKLTDIVTYPERYSKGPKDAPVTIVEFADFNCPGCRSSYPALEEMLSKPPYAGKVRTIFRHMPISGKPGHEQSDTAAYAAEFAAEKGKYWEAVDSLFRSDAELVNSISGILEIVESIGLDKDELKKRLDAADAKLVRAVYEDTEKAEKKAGLQQTPTYFIFIPGQPTQSAGTQKLEVILNSKIVQDLLK